MDLKDYIRTIPDFPKKGIQFRDITTLINNADGLKLSVDMLSDALKDIEFDAVAGIESRGFIFGTPLAYKFNKPFVMIRKKGKLPCATYSQEYALEYGTAEIEIHTDAIKPGDRVVIIDDLIATGGSARAAATLVERAGGTVAAIAFIIELPELHGRDALKEYKIFSLTSFEGE